MHNSNTLYNLDNINEANNNNDNNGCNIKNNIDIIATDGNYCYNQIINNKIIKTNGIDKDYNKHIIDKAETCLVEAFNNSLRCMLAKLNRKTTRFPKSLDNLKDSVNMLVNRDMLKAIIF